jgi:hypothetical protein
MVSTTLSLIAFCALIVWRFVFTGLRQRALAREIATPQQQHTNVLEQGLHILDLARVAVIPDYRFENGSNGVHLITSKNRANTYLRRIVALTSATQMDDAYVLDVGKMRFRVGYRYVRRLRDMTDPECAYEETCFYPVHKGLPRAEEIATALLQLTNNPALFNRWAAQSGAFKADGQAFSAAQ